MAKAPLRRKGEHGSVIMHQAYQLQYGTKLRGTAFTRTLELFNAALVQLLLQGTEIKFPARLGTFYVEKKKMGFVKLRLDYGIWRKTGEKVFHTNRHSDGYVAHFHWRKFTCLLVGKAGYEFVPCRQNTRALARIMLQEHGHKRYQQYQRLQPRAKPATTTVQPTPPCAPS